MVLLLNIKEVQLRVEKGKSDEPRERKHRYLLVFDKTLNCLWEEKPYPKIKNKASFK